MKILYKQVKKLPIKRLENFKVNINNLAKKRKLINQDLQRIENSEIYLNNIIPDRDNIPEQYSRTRIDSSKHALSCQIRPNYSIEEIKDLTMSRLQVELEEHGHSKTLVKSQKKVRNNKKTIFYNLDERKQELISHYKIHHNIE